MKGAMNFQDWCDAVDRALRSQGRSFGVSAIDPTILQKAFQGGVSPVVFAQAQPDILPNAVAVPTAPTSWRDHFLPSYRFLLFARQLLTLLAWITWIGGAIWCLIALFVLGAASASNKTPATAGAFAGIGAVLIVWYALSTLLGGVGLMVGAQLINVLVRQQLDIEEIRNRGLKT